MYPLRILSASDDVGKLATITWNDFLEVFGVTTGLVVGATFFSDLMVSTLASFFLLALISVILVVSFLLMYSNVLNINNTKPIDEELEEKMYFYIIDYLEKNNINIK